MNETKLNIEVLRQIPNKSEKAKAALRLLAGRKRARQTTTVSRLKRAMEIQGTPMTKDEAKDFLESMASAGAGVMDAKGRRRRFEWKYNLQSVAKTALGESVQGTMKRAPRPRLNLPRAAEVAPLAKQAPARASGVIVLRHGSVEIELPIDSITPETSKKVSDLVNQIKQ